MIDPFWYVFSGIAMASLFFLGLIGTALLVVFILWALSKNKNKS